MLKTKNPQHHLLTSHEYDDFLLKAQNFLKHFVNTGKPSLLKVCFIVPGMRGEFPQFIPQCSFAAYAHLLSKNIKSYKQKSCSCISDIQCIVIHGSPKQSQVIAYAA